MGSAMLYGAVSHCTEDCAISTKEKPHGNLQPQALVDVLVDSYSCHDAFSL